MPHTFPPSQPSQARPAGALAVAAALVAIDFAAVMLRRIHHRGDFDVSMEFGRRFIHGEQLYRGGLHFPYLPSAAMFFAPFAMLPRALAFALFYALAIGALGLVIRLLATMACEANPALRAHHWTGAIATLILASHYIIRDLDDGGPNIILLAIVVSGIYLAWKGREGAAAGCLGAATALKATAGIFIPFLLWKRRWRLAAYTAAAAALWIASPILKMGPASWWMHQKQWMRSAAGFAMGANQAAARYYGAGNIDNQALRPAIAHLTGAAQSEILPTLTALFLIAMFGWLTRQPYRELRGPAWLTESAGLLIVAILLAPIAWVQHLVLVIPALYLIAADWFTNRDFGFLTDAAMVLYAILALALNRAVLGKVRYSALLGCHIHTICMLLVLGVLMLRYAGGPGAVSRLG